MTNPELKISIIKKLVQLTECQQSRNFIGLPNIMKMIDKDLIMMEEDDIKIETQSLVNSNYAFLDKMKAKYDADNLTLMHDLYD